MIPDGYVSVLDKGYVGFVDMLGDDSTPANAARTSFAKRADQFTYEKNVNLINYLFKNKEYSCLRHNVLTFELRLPLIIARQLWKYIVASNFTEDQLGWNENSRRYITDDNEFYTPSVWRAAPDNKKQGSGLDLPEEIGTKFQEALRDYQEIGNYLYEYAIQDGVAPEQARLFLPAYGLYVTCFWTVSLAAVFHMLNERLEHKAQYEIQLYAQAIASIVKQQLPDLYLAWEANS